ncbi:MULTISPECIES: hypothetical protein [Clostridium]|uniref:Uncharacterized protein n=2 Tax=Clostridium TaxID=1485 RepID=D8GI78_CLOLD|nr:MULTISPECIES: hypothetical protein [Clostridium]ADK14940.1 conserved hypothetical protein [Clostridium ljungdahlii DSM 13528]OAA87935.1 hypothetical protein WX45_03419 [Clostridium ljungdahlii DSM 13528]OAA94042.1 hypothetical protein WX73_03612 [Clostridium coskatii]OBR96604.1 hypothetical protein CLCOS_07660 [Clostridium coskatii]
MSINFNKFEPRPGLVNKQGQLPDPSELVCIEVPKIFDQCLIKKCLVYSEGPDTDKTDCELRSNIIVNPKRYIDSRDFNIKLISIDKIPLKKKEGFKKIILSYIISFYADYVDINGVNKSEFYEINRTDYIESLYCPDPVSEAYSSIKTKDQDSNIINLEMVANALDGELIKDNDGNYVLDITLGYYIVVKSEFVVQLLIPAYSYTVIPKEASGENAKENPREIFEKSPVPKFYPEQNLEPLFSYYNKEVSNDDFDKNHME